MLCNGVDEGGGRRRDDDLTSMSHQEFSYSLQYTLSTIDMHAIAISRQQYTKTYCGRSSATYDRPRTTGPPQQRRTTRSQQQPGAAAAGRSRTKEQAESEQEAARSDEGDQEQDDRSITNHLLLRSTYFLLSSAIRSSPALSVVDRHCLPSLH